MKKGELKKVATDYEQLFPVEWKRVQNDFMRRNGSWVQIVAFNPSRWASEYNPVSSLDFLKKPGQVTGGLAAMILKKSRHPVQRWVTMREHEQSMASVFNEMVKQFRPHLLQLLDTNDIMRLLAEDLSYWPHAYALCITACERGDVPKAREYFAAFEAATAKKPYPEIDARRMELRESLSLAPNPEKLHAHLTRFESEKLAQLPL
jgi:hypothetical protein